MNSIRSLGEELMFNSTADDLYNNLSKSKTVARDKKKSCCLGQLLLLSLVVSSGLIYHKRFYTNRKIQAKHYRVAHCVTGIPRTFYKEEIYIAYRRQALNHLPGDVFLILQLSNKTEDVQRTTTNKNERELYKSAIAYLSPRKIEWISIGNHLGAVEDTGGMAKWKRCLDHIEQTEKENHFQYDFIVRTRPDIFIAKDLPTADLLPRDRILINPYYECLHEDILSGYTQKWSDVEPPCNKKNYGLSDLFAILPRKLADPYLNIAFTPNLPHHICGAASVRAECSIRAALYKANITFELWPFVVRIVRPTPVCQLRSWNHFNSWC
ncbi:unnamed protein product [Adineta ricciae]|uniref:Uncharacterized protein n=1 Tax=Adineta ricciae TaxID=249248 RepID=A0A814IGD5_ADIRI|nr:unnamed protein product [Adineta ricciae]